MLACITCHQQSKINLLLYIYRLLETALLLNQSYKKWEVKIGIPQFLYCGYVCMYVCVIATAYIVWARDLKFRHSKYSASDSSKTLFFVFWIFDFFQSYAPFFVFSLYILCICLLSAYRSQFFTWELNFWYEDTLALDKKIIAFSFLDFWFFLELCPFFRFFLIYSLYLFVIILQVTIYYPGT